ncbi:MAG: DUF5103 domain-containing protein [Prevotella sp.]|nr:DUF5103 domain-containing protein [Prevotella sp.]
MKRYKLLSLLLLPTLLTAKTVINDSQIRSLEAVVNNDWLSPAVMRLGSDDVLNISFDELSHDYHRYVYRVEHCEADWSPSRALFESDWLEGFNGNPIDDYEPSVNTTVAYTHYQFQIPNDQLRLKMSGNYRIRIYEEELDSREVMSIDLRVTEESMPLSLSATTNTDIDTNASHQQLSLTLGYGPFRVTNPAGQLYLVVTQNDREDNQKCGIPPTIVKPGGVEWQHALKLIFDAGNEYHKYEVLDVSHATMGIDYILWDGEYYVAYPFVSEPRPNYLYDEDANGAFYIRNSDNWENNTTSDYVWVVYRLKCPELPYGQMMIDGRWTTDANHFNYVMEYHPETGMYEARILQKQGYYSYQYLWLHNDGTTHVAPTEGSYYQTENRYQAYVYFRETGGNTWRLAAYRQIQLK